MSTVFAGGGFGGSSDLPMSESLRARIAAADREYDREAREQERERQQRIEQHRENAIVASVSRALDAGEAVDVLEAIKAGGVGHQPHEFIALASAQQEVEDLRAEQRQRAQYQRWLAHQSALASADTSAPTPLQLEEGAQMQARAEKYRETRRERSKIINAARKFASWDREAGR